jgi:NAD+ kinase
MNDCPILGVNLGTLGFLSETDIKTFERNFSFTVQNIMHPFDRRMYFQHRDVLSVYYNGEIIEDDEIIGVDRHAINDVFIRSLKIMEYDIFIESRFVGGFKGDGVMISTPTGSTGYNLSMNGPIVEPDVHVLVVNNIATHSLFTRPIIATGNISIRVRSKIEDTILQIDGQTIDTTKECYEKSDADEYNFIEIATSNEKIKVASFGNNYYDTLRDKLNWGKWR